MMPDGSMQTAAQSFAPSPATARAFRDCLGRFASGVTVVTAPTPQGGIGMTANSFTSVSLDPALILWCPAKASHRYSHFVKSRNFAVHVMGSEHSAIAQDFAKSPEAFGGLATHVNPEGITVFDDCIARYECTTVQTHDAGDHTIMVGRVTLSAHREGEALVFSRGLYGRFMGV